MGERAMEAGRGIKGLIYSCDCMGKQAKGPIGKGGKVREEGKWVR